MVPHPRKGTPSTTQTAETQYFASVRVDLDRRAFTSDASTLSLSLSLSLSLALRAPVVPQVVLDQLPAIFEAIVSGGARADVNRAVDEFDPIQLKNYVQKRLHHTISIASTTEAVWWVLNAARRLPFARAISHLSLTSLTHASAALQGSG
jgi:hypothetical protein